MGKYCKFCGSVTEEGVCPNDHDFKKMCINCSDSITEDGETFFCNNAANKEAAQKKIEDAINAAGVNTYTVEYALHPVALKKPTLKCGQWTLSEDVVEDLKGLFK